MYDSVILAKVLGLVLTMLGMGFVLNQAHIHKVLMAVSENHALQFVAAIVPLFIGSFIIVVHNKWVLDWTVLITIVGWMIFLMGAFRAIFPGFWVARIKHLSSAIPVVWVGAVLLILGVVLLYFGFNILF